MPSVLHHHLVDECKLAESRETAPHIVIVCGYGPLVEAANACERRTTDQSRAHRNATTECKIGERRWHVGPPLRESAILHPTTSTEIALQLARPPRRSGCVDVSCQPVRAHGTVRGAPDGPHQRGEGTGKPLVVVIEERDEVRNRSQLIEATISRGSDARTGLAHDANARVSLCVAIGLSRRLHGSTIAHDHKSPLIEALRDDALHGNPQVPIEPVRRHDDGDSRHANPRDGIAVVRDSPPRRGLPPRRRKTSRLAAVPDEGSSSGGDRCRREARRPRA